MRKRRNVLGKFFRIVFIGLIQLACLDPVIQARPLRVGIMHFAPFLTFENGKVGGTVLKKLEQVLRELNIEYTVDGFPPKRLYRSIATGQVDMIMSSKDHPLYSHAIIHSKNPFLTVELNLFAHIEGTLPQSEAEWANKEFILINGYGYGGLLPKLNALEKQGTVILHRNSRHLNAFRMIAARRADYLLDYTMPSRKAIKELGIGHILQRSILYQVGIYVILNRQVENAKQLLDDIEKTYHQIEP